MLEQPTSLPQSRFKRLPCSLPRITTEPEAEFRFRPSQACIAHLYLGALLALWLIAGVYAAIPVRFGKNWGLVVLPVLVVLLYLGYKATAVAVTTFEIDSERVTWSTGIASRNTGSLEIFRIQTVFMHQTLLERIFNIGTLSLLTQDRTNLHVLLIGVKHPEDVRLWFVKQALAQRRLGGRMREVAFG